MSDSVDWRNPEEMEALRQDLMEAIEADIKEMRKSGRNFPWEI